MRITEVVRVCWEQNRSPKMFIRICWQCLPNPESLIEYHWIRIMVICWTHEGQIKALLIPIRITINFMSTNSANRSVAMELQYASAFACYIAKILRTQYDLHCIFGVCLIFFTLRRFTAEGTLHLSRKKKPKPWERDIRCHWARDKNGYKPFRSTTATNFRRKDTCTQELNLFSWYARVTDSSFHPANITLL